MIEQTLLYDGAITLQFDSGRHQYRVINRGRKYKVPSVTRVTGIIDKSGPLVGWALNSCMDVVRASISPGVEYSETYLEEVFRAAKGRSRGLKDEAASIGHLAHEWIEEHIRAGCPQEGVVFPAEETPVRSCVDAALKWMGEHSIRFVENERPVYSRKHRYSGRMDGLAYVDDALAVVDWKSSNGVYPEYILQIAAYALAYKEETGADIRKAFLVRLGKDNGEFEAHELDARTLKRASGAFLSALNLWRQLERLKKKL